MMLQGLLKSIDNLVQFESVKAHCDIPCKIYDPISAQLATLTIIRMIDLIDELRAKESLSLEDHAQLNRLISQKEERGFKLKEEIRVIWGDYFKQPQFDAFPEIHELSHSIMLGASYAKQHIDKTAALELLDKVNRFATVFWQSKNIATYQATSPYPPQQVVVYPDLKS